jgi:hypothetical protein
MTEISFNKNIYSYGKFYDATKVSVPTDEQNWTAILVYVHPNKETSRIISSLEGYFVSESDLLSSEFPMANPVCDREQMKDFEKMYKGKFVPFEKLE